MSAAGTFGDIFAKACRTKSAGLAGDLAIRDGGGTSSFPLVTCGKGASAFCLSAEGIRFQDMRGSPVIYSWEQLDFILPGELSLAGDKLQTFIDLDEPAMRIARVTGRLAAVLALVGLGVLIIFGGYAFLAEIDTELHNALWYFGDLLFIAGLVAIISALAPFALLIGGGGVLAAGGAFVGLGGWFTKLFQPMVRGLLARIAGRFANGIVIVDARWVKMPWGTPTTELLDFVMVGIKLHRRGLT